MASAGASSPPVERAELEERTGVDAACRCGRGRRASPDRGAWPAAPRPPIDAAGSPALARGRRGSPSSRRHPGRSGIACPRQLGDELELVGPICPDDRRRSTPGGTMPPASHCCRMRAGVPTSVPWSIASSGIAAIASSRRPARNSSWMRAASFGEAALAPSTRRGSCATRCPCRRRTWRGTGGCCRASPCTSSVIFTVSPLNTRSRRDRGRRCDGRSRRSRAVATSGSSVPSRRQAHRQPALAQLGAQLGVARTDRRQPDRDVGRRVEDRLQRLALARARPGPV